jgi:hypothetical protein
MCRWWRASRGAAADRVCTGVKARFVDLLAEP